MAAEGRMSGNTLAQRDIDAIVQVFRETLRGIPEDRFDDWLAQWATAARLMPPGMADVVGHDQLKAWMVRWPKIKRFEVIDTDVEGDGDLAVLICPKWYSTLRTPPDWIQACREGPPSTRSCRSPFSDRMTGPRRSPVVRWRRDERRTPEKAVIDVHASRGSDRAAALLVPGRELSTQPSRRALQKADAHRPAVSSRQ
jgi:hypothetical protein